MKTFAGIVVGTVAVVLAIAALNRYGASIGSPINQSAVTQEPSSTQVMITQRCLTILGYYHGPIDGQVTKEGGLAAIAWAQARGLNPSANQTTWITYGQQLLLECTAQQSRVGRY